MDVSEAGRRGGIARGKKLSRKKLREIAMRGVEARRNKKRTSR